MNNEHGEKGRREMARRSSTLWRNALTIVMVLSLSGCEMWNRATHCPQCPAPQPPPPKVVQLPAPPPIIVQVPAPKPAPVLPPVIIEVPAPPPPLRTCQWGTSTFVRVANLESFVWAGTTYEFGKACYLEHFGAVAEVGHDGFGTMGRYTLTEDQWRSDTTQCPPGALVLIPTALFEEVCLHPRQSGGGKQKPPTEAEATEATKERVKQILKKEEK